LRLLVTTLVQFFFFFFSAFDGLGRMIFSHTFCTPSNRPLLYFHIGFFSLLPLGYFLLSPPFTATISFFFVLSPHDIPLEKTYLSLLNFPHVNPFYPLF